MLIRNYKTKQKEKMPLQQLSERWHVQLETQLKAALRIVQSRLINTLGREPLMLLVTGALAYGYFLIIRQILNYTSTRSVSTHGLFLWPIGPRIVIRTVITEIKMMNEKKEEKYYLKNLKDYWK